MGVAGADGLHGSRIFTDPRRQRHTAWHDYAREVGEPRDRHQHRRQALVAGGDPEHTHAAVQRSGEAAKHDGRIVAVGQAVEHARCALGAAVARIGAEAGKGDRAECSQPLGGRLHQQADLPVAGVVAEGQRRAIRQPHASLRREDQHLAIGGAGRRPAHACVLREPEEIAAGALAEQGVCQRQRSCGSFGCGGDLVDRRVG